MERTVTTTGQGTAYATPDRAVVRVGAAHRAAGVAEACAGVDSAVRRLAEVAREHTSADQIGTSELQVWAAHDGEGRPDGFEARHGLTVRVDTVATAGALIAALAEAVGDRLQLDGVSLEVSDPGPARVEARDAAFADAQARAEQLAGLGGARLGPVLALSEGGTHQVYAEAAGAPMRAMKDMAVEPGQQAITVSVTVTWALEA